MPQDQPSFTASRVGRACIDHDGILIIARTVDERSREDAICAQSVFKLSLIENC